MECHGAPEYVILGGRVVVDEEEMKVVQGYGQFVPTDPFPAYVYDTIKVREEVRNLVAEIIENLLKLKLLKLI